MHKFTWFIYFCVSFLITPIMAQQKTNIEWVKSIGGSNDEEVSSIALDAFGNVYSLVSFQDTIIIGNSTLISHGYDDRIIQKHNSSGLLEWSKTIGGTGPEFNGSITTDDKGNIYIAGDFCDTVDFDPGQGIYNLVAAGSTDMFILKLNSLGNFIWAKRIGGADEDGVTAIAVERSGYIYLAGGFFDTVDFDPGIGITNLISTFSCDAFVEKLDSSGNFVWAKKMGGLGTDFAKSVAVDSSGNIYTTGRFEGTADFDPGPSTYELDIGGAFIQKLTSTGNFVWAKSFGGMNSSGNSIKVDPMSNVYTTGDFSGSADFDPGLGTFSLTDSGWFDIFVQKLNKDGNFIWAKKVGGLLEDEGLSIALDSKSNVYITGYFSSTVDFDPGSGTTDLSSSGHYDIFIQKLSSAGDYIWAKSLGGKGEDQGTSIAVDGIDNFYLAGFFNDTVNFNPNSGTTNSISNGKEDGFILKWNQSPTLINNIKKQTPFSITYTIANSKLHYLLPEQAFVKLKYIEMNGRLAASLVNQSQQKGFYSIKLPTNLVSGTYVQIFDIEIQKIHHVFKNKVIYY